MPELDGLEATRAIRAAERTAGARVPIIAMTAHTMDGDRDRCRASGMDDYISKPISSVAVVQVLSRLPGLQAGSDGTPSMIRLHGGRIDSFIEIGAALGSVKGRATPRAQSGKT